MAEIEENREKNSIIWYCMSLFEHFVILTMRWFNFGAAWVALTKFHFVSYKWKKLCNSTFVCLQCNNATDMCDLVSSFSDSLDDVLFQGLITEINILGTCTLQKQFLLRTKSCISFIKLWGELRVSYSWHNHYHQIPMKKPQNHF